jgi:toxin ParE1/3/4
LKNYRVEITRTAESDLKELFHYIALDNPAAASRFITEMENQIHSLEKFPLRSPVIPESQDLGKEYRHILYGNYRTIFRVEGARGVIILRVIHGARLLDWSAFQK